ncbi:NUDIX domain-containing protein [Austwickia sp. TVS 96-490-7B]|uniref:NUDIX domain-containing protein n=1 Tax=Austwickia sp. TVS 96-490-7B TaxID=2830843 RepID=UPI001C588326|nr:NUDIX domain-containing protein [Austwickia sp. TVS 96-490-7B]
MTLHADAVQLLARWTAPNAQQEALRRSFAAALAASNAAIHRDGPAEHLTVGVLVLDDTGEHVLLTHHRKADAWFQFGGHLEPSDCTVRAAAARELAEESGISGLAVSAEPCQLSRHDLPEVFGHCRAHLDVRYWAQAPAGAIPTVSDESLDVRWFPVTALPPGAAADVGPLITAAQAAQRRGDGIAGTRG